MDVAAWLQGLGLERYAPAFHDNDIDAELLRELTAEDLIEHRRELGRPPPQLLDAIAALGAAVPAALAAAAPATSDAPAPQPRPNAGS